MIRVKILPPYGCDRSALDERGWAELPDGACVADVLKLLRCSTLKAKLLLVSVNGERVSTRMTLHDGDVVGFFSLATGG